MRKPITINCGGHCCKRFTFLYSPTELENNRRAIKKGRPTSRRDNGRFAKIFLSKDLTYMENMLIFIGKSTVNPSDGVDNGIECNIYTCRHLKKDGKCGDYDNRPDICSHYPYEKKCKYKKCCK